MKLWGDRRVLAPRGRFDGGGGGGHVEDAPPPREQQEAEVSRRVLPKYWETIDNLYLSTVESGKRAFNVNVQINIVIVAVGVGLILNSIAYSWVKGLDALSVVSASIGVADFVVIFFANPQKNIHVTLGNFTQIQMAYRTYLSNLEIIWDCERKLDRSPTGLTIEDLKELVKQFEEITSNAMKRVECFVEGKTVEKTVPPHAK